MGTSQSSWIKVSSYKGQAFWEVAFADGGREVKRRIGPAWLVPAGDAHAKPNGKTFRAGKWVERQGRPKGGALSYDAARERVPSVLADFQAASAEAVAKAKAIRAEAERPRAFRELAQDWRAYLDRKGTKPSTLVGYDAILAEPGTAFRRSRGQKVGYIMAALGDKPATDVTVGDVEALLTAIAATGASPRTVEKHRIMVRSILNYGIRETKRALAGRGGDGYNYGLSVNAAQVADGPRQRSRGALIYYLPEEVEAIARALEQGQHRHEPTRRDEAERLSDRQDAAAVRVSAYTGLRLGELLALRWSDIDWAGSALTVSRAISAGQEATTKSGKVRRVPLPDQAMAALDSLSRREDFTAPGEYVFCNVTTGRSLNDSALRRRYKDAQVAAGVHALRWHDLRHTYGSLLAASGEELVTIKAAMGHANITTTEVYLHARPATELAGRFTAAFAMRPVTTPAGESALEP